MEREIVRGGEITTGWLILTGSLQVNDYGGTQHKRGHLSLRGRILQI
jgi:hypothetical protein